MTDYSDTLREKRSDTTPRGCPWCGSAWVRDEADHDWYACGSGTGLSAVPKCPEGLVWQDANRPDWTRKDGRSNSSDLYTEVVETITKIMCRNGGGNLDHEWVRSNARTAVSNLAHLHHIHMERRDVR